MTDYGGPMLQAIIEQYGIPAFGVSLVLTLVWLAGGRRNLKIDAARLKHILQVEGIPDNSETVIAADARSALIHPGNGHPPMLVRSQGDYWTTTALVTADTSISVDPANAAGLQFRFTSPGQSNTTIVLPDAGTASLWLRYIGQADGSIG